MNDAGHVMCSRFARVLHVFCALFAHALQCMLLIFIPSSELSFVPTSTSSSGASVGSSKSSPALASHLFLLLHLALVHENRCRRSLAIGHDAIAGLAGCAPAILPHRFAGKRPSGYIQKFTDLRFANSVQAAKARAFSLYLSIAP